tara:strand:+ start:304 stop:774 length:471 start_codon:yes stop_codon:yes gene_type:complete
LILPNLLESNGRIEEYKTLNDKNHLINYGFFPEYPSVGPLHIAASVQNSSNMEYINAEVLIHINGPDFNEKNSAKKSLDSPLFYEYDTILKNTGDHEIKIIIESKIGKTEILNKINVKESTNILNSVVIFIMFLLIFIPILIFIRKYMKLRELNEN